MGSMHIATNDPQRVEQIHWVSCADEYPDADTTVLLYCPELDEPVWPGAWDDQAQVWVVDGYECEPTFWAPMPGGPTF
jgi:hypothetical protein